MSTGEQNGAQCCAAFYGSSFARVLLGESFHPGGIALTQRLGELLEVGRDAHVLDVASGRGTSAFHLAGSFGCRVTGVDLSAENVAAASAEARQRGLGEQVAFQLGDAETLPFPDQTFDAIVCECAFCTFTGKDIAAREFYRVLKPGAQLGLSDLTRTAGPLPELDGLLAWIACIGDAQPVERYAALLDAAGFKIGCTEDHSGALIAMVEQIQVRLLWAEIMVGLKKLELPGADFSTARQFAKSARQAIRDGKLGYAIVMGSKA